MLITRPSINTRQLAVLTLHDEHHPLADRGRDAVRCDAQVGTHVGALRPEYRQRGPVVV